MNLSSAEKIVNAALYEGYILYPYRPTAIKNRQRWTFGGLFPSGWRPAVSRGDASRMQCQCLLREQGEARIEIRLRFLHLVARQAGELSTPVAEWPAEAEPDYRRVAMVEVDGRQHFSWEEAVEREVVLTVTLDGLRQGERRHAFRFQADRDIETLRRGDGLIAALLVRSQLPVEGELTLRLETVAQQLHRLTLSVDNHSLLDDPGASREQAQLRSMASTHLVLGIEGGAFISLLDPPAELKAAAEACENRGCWPVLVGEPGCDDTLLASPIILYDHPQIAPESPGDLFDGLEIDELLILRILTLTPEEKREMAAVDQRARCLLERTEALGPEQLQALHGRLRDLRRESGSQAPPPPATVMIDGAELHLGDRVRLRPRAGGDVLDIVLRGKSATIEAIERDFEDRVHLAVTIDEDPGRDLGFERMPGHRFFFAPDEVEPLAEAERSAAP